ncbi:MAG: DEAD/DEAH box helicase [Planctomycetota bacterium]|jgi:superfamily II DNA or RNA helicase|nr:DEAD/DEAH box helicase [Planctomycetota bacterium]
MAMKTKDYLDAYNSLSLPDQTVLQALSALYEPAGSGVVASCLTGAGCRESHLRAFTLQTVAVRLAHLTKLGLAKTEIASDSGKKVKLWRCQPEVAEIAIRHAIRDGIFRTLARTVAMETRGRDWLNASNSNTLRRNIRLAFHSGAWELALKEAWLLEDEEAYESGVLLGEIIRLQPDDSWLPTEANPEAATLLRLVLSFLASSLGDPTPFLELAARPVFASDPWLTLEAGEVLLLAGKEREVEKLATTVRSEEVSHRLRQGLYFLAGQDRESLDEAGQALVLQRRRLSNRSQLLTGRGLVWQVLSTIRLSNRELSENLSQALLDAKSSDPENQTYLGFLRQATLFQLGHSFAARSLPNPGNDGGLTPALALLLEGLTTLWLDPKGFAALREKLTQGEKRARTRGYQWLADQFTALLTPDTGEVASDPKPASPARGATRTWPRLALSFVNQDKWRRELAALQELLIDQPPPEESRKRLVWLVSPNPDSPPNPYCPFRLKPLEQKMGKDGIWSKGRSFSPASFLHRDKMPESATSQDVLILTSIRSQWNYDYDDYYVDSGSAFLHLTGHPLVFREAQDGQRIDVVQGKLDIIASEKDGDLEICLDPPLSDFLPAGQLPEIKTPEVMVRFDTPARLQVIRLDWRGKRLARIIGQGLVMPPPGREETLAAVTSLSRWVRVHFAIPGLQVDGETRAADSTPRFHLVPLEPGLRIELWSHPLGDDGPAYLPGQGGRLLFAEVGGESKHTLRDLEEEKTRAEQVVAACPSLVPHQVAELSWNIAYPEDCLTFLEEAENLEGSAILTWPNGGRQRVRQLPSPAALDLAVTRHTDWLELSGGIKIDEKMVLSLEPLLKAIREGNSRFVAMGDGEFLALTKEFSRQIEGLAAFSEEQAGQVRLPILASGLVSELAQGGATLKADQGWWDFLDRRRELDSFSPPVPDSFRGELRDYQLEGYHWLSRLAEWGVGACLADDMGLGKTVQAIALLAARAKAGPALVVAPTSVCHNWLAELERFAPDLNPVTFSEGDRQATLDQLKAGDIVVISYGLLQQEADRLYSVNWTTAVLDEAQAIKNVATKRSRAAMGLQAGFKLITTGTPVENHLSELWNLFNFINPMLLGNWRRFQERFAIPIERHNNPAARENLRQVIRPFILRRSKNQVLSELPEKSEITLRVEMGPEERAFYEGLRRQAVERVNTEIRGKDGISDKRFLILAEITRLRRACCTPELISNSRDIPSAKQEQFQEKLAELLDNGHKALIFSQFVSHLDIIRRHLDETGLDYQYLDGSSTPRERKKAVGLFQAGTSSIFLISLKAGGLGLNLTAADYVIHMDPWWNPAVEDQASDRAHRIGQTRPVTVYRLVTANTIEEKIVELHRYKRDLADSLLSGTDSAGPVDLEELVRLLRED